jgi:DNA-binding NtrC family response regulator/ligand-binding sensor domain-containing protein
MHCKTSSNISLFLTTAGLFLFTHCLPIHAFPRLKFDRLMIEDGLSQSIVNCIMQDRRGFMWFCTEDGLNQYDGYTFTVLRNNPQNDNSLSQNYTLCIAEDKSGFLWISTFYGGLNRYNPESGEFVHFRADPETPNALAHDIVRTLFVDSDGFIWAGTDGGLTRFDPGSGQSVSYYNNPHHPQSLCSNRIRTIAEDRQGFLWIGTDEGLCRFDKKKELFDGYFHDPADVNSLSHNAVRKIFIDRGGTIWIGTNGGGLDKLTFSADGRAQFTHFQHSPGQPTSLSHNQVFSICEDHLGALWIGTNGGGLNLFDRSSQTFTHFTHDPRDPQSISYNEIYDIAVDQGGVMWLGTYGGGISKLSRLSEQFVHVHADARSSNGLNHNIVWAIAEDKEGILWLGTHGGGLNRYDRLNQSWNYYRNQPNNRNSLSNDFIRVIHLDKAGLMWIGTNGGGLNRFDPKSERFTVYRHDPDNPASLSHDELRCIFEDRDGVLWIGTNGGGLNKFNRAQGTFKHYLNQPTQSTSISNNFVRAIYQDDEGFLWIGTQGGGLEKFDPATEKFVHYRSSPANPNSLCNDNVFSIHGDGAGNLWLGTWGGGLDKFDRKTEHFTHYTQEQGLPDNAIYGILEDDSGHLWISTNNGISMYNPSNETFKNYNTDDGLQSTEFNGGSFFKSSSGEMFFGGINGFNSFFPETIQENKHIPPIVITSFLKFNRPQPMQKLLNNGALKLSCKDYFFSFEFAALDYTAPDKNRYAYKMEGLDADWIYTSASKRFASYTTLRPGNYVFRVKGANNDGYWNETGERLNISISPPFWQTWWFRAAAAMITMLALYFALEQRIKTIRRKRLELEQRIKERTEAAEKLQTALAEVEILKNRLQAENIYLQDEIKLVTNFENIVTQSSQFKKALLKVEQVAATEATVLILGESGTGKELIARAIHNLSNRSDRILVKVNCAALPANLIESELFGHEKGAFTGAIAKKAGRFELADGGTLFLDEIGDLPLDLQVKLLRVLQEGEFDRVGGSKPVHVNVRIIAATNRDLQKEIKAGRFREDLFFRLNVFPIFLPPLRERPEDIPLLVNYFIKKYSVRVGKTIEMVPKNLLDSFTTYQWPGNVRELENVVERAVITSRGKSLSLEEGLPAIEKNSDTGFLSLEEMEKEHIHRALQLTNWRVSGEHGAAKLLGINAKTLESRMQKLGISRTGEIS